MTRSRTCNTSFRGSSAAPTAQLGIGSVPSIANVMVPRAIAERAQDAAQSSDRGGYFKDRGCRSITCCSARATWWLSSDKRPTTQCWRCAPLARGRLKCIVPDGHPLARRTRVTAAEIVKHPLIGVDPNDPYGRIMAERLLPIARCIMKSRSAPASARPFALWSRKASASPSSMNSRSPATNGREFACARHRRNRRRFKLMSCYRKDVPLSSHAGRFAAVLATQMEAVARRREK